MQEYLGKVIKVFTVKNQIGFDVDINGTIITIIENQDDNNINIYKDDTVIITEYEISNSTFRDIRLYGDINE